MLLQPQFYVISMKFLKHPCNCYDTIYKQRRRRNIATMFKIGCAAWRYENNWNASSWKYYVSAAPNGIELGTKWQQ